MNAESAPPVALITGAAGGLGSALVTQFASQGWQVAAGFHNAPLKTSGERVMAVPLDVTSAESVATGVKQIMDRWGRIDVLINNAGVTSDALLLRMTEADWDRVLACSLKGAFLVSQAVLRPMMKQRSGHILNVSSFSAHSGPVGQANYAAAKAGLIGLTQSLAKEVGSRNVRVNAILPGVLPTAMTAHLSAEAMEEFGKANALGRINDVDEVAQFVVFLAGMKNVSGQVFQLDSRIGRWC